jgi:hypothetical protein
VFANLPAAEFDNGDIRLTINEKTGNFSLYYLSIPEKMRYEPLFYSREQKSSFLEINIDGVVYRLGKSKRFSTRFDEQNGNPAVVYESPSLIVRKVFTPIRTANSQAVNGLNITVTVQNTGNQAVSAGLRFLIDTHLGETRKGIPFETNNQYVLRERLIEGTSGEMYWISRGPNFSLMGSIINPYDRNSKVPDFVHMASWKRLNKANWNLKYKEGRSFNYFPYFFSDSAVCYYYEPAMLEAGESFTYTVILSTEDIGLYTGISTFDFSALRDGINYADADLIMLYRLLEILNQFVSGEITLNEGDLAEIERTIQRLKAGAVE